MQERGGPRPFDAATRGLIDRDPEGWLRWLGLPVDGPVSSVDSDLATALAAVDKVLRIDSPAPWLAHVELQASSDPALPLRLLQYHALLLHRHQIPVATTLVLLRPQARLPGLTGRLQRRGPNGETTITFRYRVVRLWERPVDEILAGGLGVLPLAPLAAVEQSRLPEILHSLDERFDREAPPSTADELWAATLLLMGVRYDRSMIRALGERVRRMRESVTYQMIIEEGIEQGIEQGRAQGELAAIRRVLLHLGAQRLGQPPADVTARIEGATDLAALERASERILSVGSWDELLELAGA